MWLEGLWSVPRKYKFDEGITEARLQLSATVRTRVCVGVQARWKAFAIGAAEECAGKRSCEIP